MLHVWGSVEVVVLTKSKANLQNWYCCVILYILLVI